MLHKLYVYGEHLAEADLSKTTTGANPVEVSGTQGALIVNVIAKGDAKTAKASEVGVKVAVLAADEPEGSFAEVTTITLPDGTYVDDEVIASVTLPPDVKNYAKATVTGNTSSSGNVIVTLGYLAR